MKIAVVQMLVTPGAKEENLSRAEQRIAEAAAAGADLIVLPEAMTLGWTHPSARELADAMPNGECARRLRDAAKRHAAMVCSGLVERDRGSIFNSALLIDADGEVLLLHRKIHELGIAHDLYARGDRLNVADTAFGRIGLMICADGFAPGLSISRTLGLMSADLIVSPCAWAVPADHDNEREPYGKLWMDSYGPVCRDFRLWIAGVSNVGPITAGPWAGRKCIGNSLLIDPEGHIAARGRHGENADEIIYADVEL
jgi:predicted amidohydrolase